MQLPLEEILQQEINLCKQALKNLPNESKFVKRHEYISQKKQLQKDLKYLYTELKKAKKNNSKLNKVYA